MHEVLVNRLGGLSLPRKSVVRLTDRPDMTLDVYRGRKTTMQQQSKLNLLSYQYTGKDGTGRVLFFFFFFFSTEAITIKYFGFNFIQKMFLSEHKLCIIIVLV